MKAKGVSWEEGFCDGLVKSRIFLPLLSKGVLSNFEKLRADSYCDNVLLEYNLALELRERGLIWYTTLYAVINYISKVCCYFAAYNCHHYD